MPPHYRAILCQKQPRHLPGVANRHARHVALQRCPETAGPHIGGCHLAQAAPFKSKSPVKISACIGDRPGLRPRPVKESFAVGSRTLIEKENGRVSRLRLGELAQILDRFAAEESAKVAQKDQQGRLVAQLIGQRAGPQVNPRHGGGEDGGIDGIHVSLIYLRLS